jgi:hypothetical protein
MGFIPSKLPPLPSSIKMPLWLTLPVGILKWIRWSVQA